MAVPAYLIESLERPDGPSVSLVVPPDDADPNEPIFAPLPLVDIGQVYRGDTFTLPVWQALDYYKEVLDLTGSSVWFTAKVDLAQLDADPGVIQVSTAGGGIMLVDPENGEYQVTVIGAQTQPLDDDTMFIFDVQVRTASPARTVSVKRGTMTVIRDVTRASA